MVEEISKCCQAYVSLHGYCSNCQKQHDYQRHARFKIGDKVKVVDPHARNLNLIGTWEGMYINRGNYSGLDQVHFEFSGREHTAYYQPDDLIKVGTGLIKWLQS